MPRSFTPSHPGMLAAEPSVTHRRVLVTGAGGNIGTQFADYAHDHYELRLMVQSADQVTSALQAQGEIVVGDLLDLPRMKALCSEIDTVVHLAANPDADATWRELLPANFIGTYHIMAAAKAAGCRRVIFASSIHAVSGYPPDVQVHTDDPVNPGDLYGVSKCFGEALGRYMAEQEGLSVIAVRIGAYGRLEEVRTEESIESLDTWVSPRDLCQLITHCIDVENLRFAIFHGVSNNHFKRLDISDARMLVGYAPDDDLSVENPQLKHLKLAETTATHNLSGGSQQSGLRDDL